MKQTLPPQESRTTRLLRLTRERVEVEEKLAELRSRLSRINRELAVATRGARGPRGERSVSSAAQALWRVVRASPPRPRRNRRLTYSRKRSSLKVWSWKRSRTGLSRALREIGGPASKPGTWPLESEKMKSGSFSHTKPIHRNPGLIDKPQRGLWCIGKGAKDVSDGAFAPNQGRHGPKTAKPEVAHDVAPRVGEQQRPRGLAVAFGSRSPAPAV